jgi:hypothetical protein
MHIILIIISVDVHICDHSFHLSLLINCYLYRLSTHIIFFLSTNYNNYRVRISLQYFCKLTTSSTHQTHRHYHNNNNLHHHTITLIEIILSLSTTPYASHKISLSSSLQDICIYINICIYIHIYINEYLS